MVTKGYVEKTRVLLCRSRTHDVPNTTSGALPLSYRRLMETRPLVFPTSGKTQQNMWGTVAWDEVLAFPLRITMGSLSPGHLVIQYSSPVVPLYQDS